MKGIVAGFLRFYGGAVRPTLVYAPLVVLLVLTYQGRDLPKEIVALLGLAAGFYLNSRESEKHQAQMRELATELGTARKPD